jgi:hypothetical protein
MFRSSDGGETVTNQHDRRGARPGDPAATADPLRPGAIQVWCASLGRWVDGFHLVGRTVEGCLVRRLSDGEVLPLAFSEEHVRPPAGATGFAAGDASAG